MHDIRRLAGSATSRSTLRRLGGSAAIAAWALAGCSGSGDGAAAEGASSPTTEPPSADATPTATTAAPAETSAPPTSSTTTTSTTTTTTTTEPPVPTIPPATYPASELPRGVYRVLGDWALLDDDEQVIGNDSARSCPTVAIVPVSGIAFVDFDGETYAIGDQTSVDPIADGCRDGTFIVGVDIAPGQYRIVPDVRSARSRDSGASWARLDRSLDTVESHTSDGPIYVNLRNEDFAVTFTGERLEVSDHPTAGLTADEVDSVLSETARTAWDERSFDERAAICGAIALEDRETAVALTMSGVEDEPYPVALAEKLYVTAASDCGE